MRACVDDFRHALRNVRGRPKFAFAAVLVLGIGTVTAIFAAYHAVPLKPLPFVDPVRNVRVMRELPPVGNSRVSPSVLREWAEHSGDVLDAIGARTRHNLNRTWRAFSHAIS